ncbi:hypothetical protein GCM10007071_08980 [Marinobacter zhanjiangensis]|uniref:Uncharacterized protein n=1 Tax=Marinobacter zhanjiangensis TaxID=578215 RepID=A0ABQ3ASK5_9GAMM|nr:hypothetical protein GCM10007071_08980 [Marinobacter zhanjiangensis]
MFSVDSNVPSIVNLVCIQAIAHNIVFMQTDASKLGARHARTATLQYNRRQTDETTTNTGQPNDSSADLTWGYQAGTGP